MGKRQERRKERRNLKLVVNNKGPKVLNQGIVKKVLLPDEEKTLLKEVPAKVDEVVVGKALIYDDGSVDIMINEDADPEAVAKIKATEAEFGYRIGGIEDGAS